MTKWNEIIDKICKDNHISMAQLADRIGKSRQYISQLRRGLIQSPTQEVVEAIEKNFNISVSNNREVQLFRQDGSYDHSVNRYYNLADKFSKSYPGKLEAMEVVGDSMYPTYKTGDILLFVAGLTKGDGVFAVLVNEILTVKRMQTTANGSVCITSDNPKYKAMIYNPDKVPDFIRVVGKVVGRVEEY